MPDSKKASFPDKIIKFGFSATTVFSLFALVATFLVSNSTFSPETKTAIFLVIFITYLITCAAFYLWQSGYAGQDRNKETATGFSEEIEEKLFALEEANEFFGASLNFADMFRLIASRINEIVPFAACILFLKDEQANNLKIRQATGESSGQFKAFNADINRSLAAKVFLSQKGQIDLELLFDKRVFGDEILKNFSSAIAVPLFERQKVFGVLVLYSEKKNTYRENDLLLVEALGERVAPLVRGSIAFERSIENALTDSLTGLPNERAFCLMLENKIAESIRYRHERSLIVLAIDIQGFDELNKRYGHATGDRILKFTAKTIKNQLRQMDVLSRLSGDEFLAILPTAEGEVGKTITWRISQAFSNNAFEISEKEKVCLQLNFGIATFGQDGETVGELLQTALLRKLQNKSAEKGNILWFPGKSVN